MSALFPASGAPTAAAPRQSADGSPIYTVSQLTRRIREALERQVGLVWLTGEVGNLRVPASGHCYFTLKDESAQIAAVMWRTLAETLKFRMAEGLSVLAQGEVTVYEPRGQYQISVRRIEPLGVGALQLAFLQMKERLEKEGLFDPARKRPIPLFPRTVALVTSPSGAAIRDMLRVLRRRCPSTRVIICPVRVQGAEAAGEIAEGIALVNRLAEVEVMIVGRGGGSLEDLWPFNEEVMARAIARSRIPVISAVGHETDFTISDFVADLRALTPTDAANQVVPDVGQLAEDLGGLRRRLGRALTAGVASARQRLAAFAQRCEPRRFEERVRDREQRVDELCQRLVRDAQRALEFQNGRLSALSGRLESLSPYAVLRRGYSITLRGETQGAAVRDAAELRPGDLVRTRLHRGEFRSRVE
jgi:exodeoxyribonuclease VII large subunit